MTSNPRRLRAGAGVFPLLLVVSALLSSSTVSAGGLPGKWAEARSAHFVVLGNASEKELVEIARNYERIRELFAQRVPQLAPPEGPPLRIFVARDEGSMKVLMPGQIRASGRGVIGGRFFDGPTAQFIQLETQYDEVTDQIVFHEYFHYFVSRLDLAMPLWLAEGLADFWGATRFTEDSLEIGRLIPGRMKRLSQPFLPKLERLLVLDRASREYRDRAQIGGIYAESWALVHYLGLGEKGKRNAQLGRYLQLVADGKESLAAAREAFGDLAELEDGFRRYVRGFLFPYGKLPPAAKQAPMEIPVRSVDDGEAAARIAIAQFHTETTADMARWCELATRVAPGAAVTDLARGLLALREDRHADAEAAFARATQAADAEAISWYGLAVLKLRRDRPPVPLAEVQADLLRALEVDPGFAPAHSRLAALYLRLGGGANRSALASIRRARRLRPDDGLLTVREIQILDRLGLRAEVEERTAKLVAEALGSQAPEYLNSLCWDGTLLGLAGAFHPLCEKAVELEPKTPNYLDSRGVARGVTGDLAGALADLRAALAVPDLDWKAETRAQRQRWIDDLQQGRNPFTPELLQELLDGPSAILDWGH